MSNLTTASLRGRWTKLIMCLLLSSLLVAPASLAQQPQEPYLVTDINQQSVGSNIDSMTPVGDRLFFFADDGWHGREVWTSDGTAAGTYLVKDIWPGSDGSPEPFPMTALGNRVVFIAADAFLSFGLWVSDGTEAGTYLLAANTNPDYEGNMSITTVGDAVYFVGHDALHGRELWVTDGASAGTRLVADIFPGGNDSDICCLTCLGDTLFFRAYDGVHGLELWVSDGTAAGTTMVKDIQSGAGSGLPHGMTAVGDTLFFIATDGSAYHYGYGLWASDGTGPGTHLVNNIWPWYIYPEYGTYIPGIEYETLTALGDTLFFTADDNIHGDELWASDGTASGTHMVADIAPGLYPAMQGSRPAFLTVMGDTLFLYATDNVHGRELWASDGTEAGTRLVVDLNPGSAASVGMVWQPPAAVNGTLFFSATDGPYAHYKLWASDGTGAGTRLVADINPGGSWTAPGGFTPVGDTLFFIADDGVHGYELWALPLPPLAPRMYLPLIRR